MNEEDWIRFNELKEQIQCTKNFTCVRLEIEDLCNAKYHVDVNILECLEKMSTICDFPKYFYSILICTCPLRKFIAQNLEKWIAWKKSTDNGASANLSPEL